MTGIKIEWEEPGPATWTRMLVEYGPEYDHRDPTESDLTRALELLAPEVRGRVIGAVKAGGGADHRHLVDVMFGHLPTGTSGMVQGADGWEYPTSLADANVAHWKDVAEKATTEAAKLRGDCRELGAKLAEATTHPRSFVCDEEMRAALFADCAAAKRRGDELEKERDELKAQLAASQSMERQVWRQILEAQRERDEAKDTIATLERTRCQIREALDAPERLTTPEAARRLLAERDAAIGKLEAVRRAAQ